MKEKINGPDRGESVSSGIIAAWLKVDGEFVAEGDELFELETDKATLAVPSTVSGVLLRLAEEGEEVEVGQVVAEIDTAAAGSPSPSAAGSGAVSPAVAASRPTKAAAGNSAASLNSLSPAVRRIVVENNLDPGSIPGTGKDGRITKADALAVLSKVRENVDALPEAQSPAARADPAAGVTEAPTVPGQHREKMTRLRKRIAENRNVLILNNWL